MQIPQSWRLIKHEKRDKILLPLGLLCGRRLKSDVRLSDVRPSVRRFCDFCDICLYSLNIALHGTPLLLTEENQVLIFEPSSFFIQTGILYRLFSAFFKNWKKVHEWCLAVKCEKANKWTHFLSVKTSKIQLFGNENSWPHQIDVTEHHFLNSSTQEPQGVTLALQV